MLRGTSTRIAIPAFSSHGSSVLSVDYILPYMVRREHLRSVRMASGEDDEKEEALNARRKYITRQNANFEAIFGELLDNTRVDFRC